VDQRQRLQDRVVDGSGQGLTLGQSGRAFTLPHRILGGGANLFGGAVHHP
jgi:hypothetical protein